LCLKIWRAVMEKFDVHKNSIGKFCIIGITKTCSIKLSSVGLSTALEFYKLMDIALRRK